MPQPCEPGSGHFHLDAVWPESGHRAIVHHPIPTPVHTRCGRVRSPAAPIRPDSVSFDAKYVDSGRNCSGTFTGKGTVATDGSKASGAVAIKDGCEGDITGTFRLWR